MDRFPIPKGTNQEMGHFFNSIMDDALGQPIELSAAPTTAGGELSVGQVAIYGNDLYINIEGTVRKFTGTAV